MENNITDNGFPINIKKKLGQLYRLEGNRTVSLVPNDSFGITNTMFRGGVINS